MFNYTNANMINNTSIRHSDLSKICLPKVFTEDNDDFDRHCLYGGASSPLSNMHKNNGYEMKIKKMKELLYEKDKEIDNLKSTISNMVNR